MKIAGLQKLSLVDFPGTLSAVIFLAGCDFRCPYCYNTELVEQGMTEVFSEEKVFEYLLARRELIEGVVVTGGEPTIHGEIVPFLDKLRALGYRLKLDTNGAHPEVISEVVGKGLVDFVALDIKTSFERYNICTDEEKAPEQVARTLGFLLRGDVAYELRTTCVPEVVTESDIKKIARSVKGAKRYALQQFQGKKTLNEAFTGKTPYPKEELLRFKNILSRTVGNVVVRGI